LRWICRVSNTIEWLKETRLLLGTINLRQQLEKNPAMFLSNKFWYIHLKMLKVSPQIYNCVSRIWDWCDEWGKVRLPTSAPALLLHSWSVSTRIPAMLSNIKSKDLQKCTTKNNWTIQTGSIRNIWMRLKCFAECDFPKNIFPNSYPKKSKRIKFQQSQTHTVLLGFLSISKYALHLVVIFEAHVVFFWVGYPGQESNLGRREGNPARNLLDQPDSLKSIGYILF